MFEAECLHTPYLPPPSSSSGFRSPALKASNANHHIPEGDLLNLDSNQSHGSNGNTNMNVHSNTNHSVNIGSPEDEVPKRSTSHRRKTGFQKKPGSRRNSKVDSGSGGGGGGGSDWEDSDDDFEEEEWVPDLFLFEFGTVVIWGMTEKEEKAFLRSL